MDDQRTDRKNGIGDRDREQLVELMARNKWLADGGGESWDELPVQKHDELKASQNAGLEQHPHLIPELIQALKNAGNNFPTL